MKKQFEKLTAPVCIFKIIYLHEPSYLIWSMLQIAANAVLPLLYVYAPKRILEALTAGSGFADVLKIIFSYGAILFLISVGNTFFANKASLAASRFAKKLQYNIGIITMALPVSDIERASTAEAVNLAKNAFAITETASYLSRTISNAITIAGLAYLIVRLDAVSLLSVLAVVSVKSVFTYVQFRYNKKARLLSAQNERVGNYLMGLAYFNHGAEKEIRVDNLQDWFIGKNKAYRNEMVTLQYRDFKYTALFEAILTIVTVLQSFLVLTILAGNYINGTIRIADFTMLFTAITSLTAALSAFSDQISLYNRQVMNVSDYQKLTLFHACDGDSTSGMATTKAADGIGIIRFEHVSFIYPGGKDPVLSDIHITIQDGEKLVIVGLNGAGKSTFIKLLCKFYKPTSGRITVNGIDIWSIPNSRYYALIGVVFQDFTNFAFTMRENIAFTESADNEKICAVLRELGMDIYANQTDTYITKTFSPNGIEPSGGEEQKLAIARAVYKDASLLILDEPTASLDVKAESEIYRNFFRMAKDKTTVFISHRLACSKVADRIAVFSGGRITEYGNHDDLVRQGGLYAEMYEKQSKLYVKEKN